MAIKIPSDSVHLLQLLQWVLNPNVRFHTHNAQEKSNTCQQTDDALLFAKVPSEGRPPKGWLVDFINWFGKAEGFDNLLKRFVKVSNALATTKQQSRHNSGGSSAEHSPRPTTSETETNASSSRQQSSSPAPGELLNIQLISALLKPFASCHEFLLPSTIQTYFLPIRDHLFAYLDTLSDQQIQKFSSAAPRNDGRMGESLGSVLRYLRMLLLELPESEKYLNGLEDLRLKLIMRQLHSTTFSTKMAGLAELNRLASSQEQDDFLAVERLTAWLSSGNLLPLLLKDFLHLPQYIERVEKLLRFMIRHRAIGAAELDSIWSSQTDQHEAIVKNIHDLLARLAWDFSAEQLDHFFGLIAKAWPSASRRQQEQLLLLLKRLAEEDRDGQTANKVLHSLWTMVREPGVSVLVLEQALACHAAVLEGCIMSRRDEVRWQWLMLFIEDIKRDPIGLALPELRQIHSIIETWPQSTDMQRRMNAPMANESSRSDIIHKLREHYSIFDFLIDNLGDYMKYVKQNYGQQLGPDTMPDDRYDHYTQLKERLRLIRFLLQEGDVWLSDMHATKIWQILAVGWVHSCDRDICFKWFSKLVANGPDMDPSTIGPFFVNQFLQLDPCLMTENGVACFRAFFHHANKEPLPVQQQQTKQEEVKTAVDEPLIGMDYLWRIVLQAEDMAADSAAVLLRDSLSELALLPVGFNHNEAASCLASIEMVAENFVERFRVAADSARPLIGEVESDKQRQVAVSRLLRVLTLIRAVIANTDAAFTGIRVHHPPLWRLCIGKQHRVRVRFSTAQNVNNSSDELVYETNSHEQVAMLRQWAASKLNVHDVQLLRPGSSPLMQHDYSKVFDEAGIPDNSTLIVRVIPIQASAGANMGMEMNDADSSDAECSGAVNENGSGNGDHTNNHTNNHRSATAQNDETSLLSVHLAKSPVFISMLLDVADWAPSSIRSATLLLLKHLPANPDLLSKIKQTDDLQSLLVDSKPVKVFYLMKLMAALLCPVRGIPDPIFMERFIKSAVPTIHNLLLQERVWPADILAQALQLLNITCGLLAVAGIVAVQKNQQYCSQTFLEHEKQLNAILLVCPPLCFSSVSSWGEFLLKKFSYRLPLNLVEQIDSSKLPEAVRNMAWSTMFTGVPICKPFQRNQHDTTTPGFSLILEEDSCQFINEAVHLLSALLLLNPERAQIVRNDEQFQTFFVDFLLVCPVAQVRCFTNESLYQLAANPDCWNYFIPLFFSTLSTTTQHCIQERSFEFCDLICRLLTVPNCSSRFPSDYWQELLVDRWKAIAALHDIPSTFRDNQLAICARLAALLTHQQRSFVGTADGGPKVLNALVENFIFSPSLFLRDQKDARDSAKQQSLLPNFSAETVEVALTFAGRLVEDSISNLEYAVETVVQCMSADPDSLPTNEWECACAIGPRPAHGYVGLKNAGATCYMNSVLQQLFMLDPIRDAILSVNDSILDVSDVESNKDVNSANSGTNLNALAQVYNKTILSDLRLTFAFLLMAEAQFYTPTDLWHHLRLGGEAVNVREQHDALEFLHSLGDAVDEAMRKSLPKGVSPIIERTLGGTFADLKICRDCPHRYSREETFTTISVDVRNHRNLHESLDQYVRPDLLDGQNAYFCEQCQAKVTAIKRLCVRNLPPVLVIQLKRFDYDWERECATKFNDYFEFPRQLDMEPYTESGIARRDVENTSSSSGTSTPTVGDDPALYNLIGVVVHSGQASGGHYYSFVKRKSDQKWFRFDDCDVGEASLDEDHELRNQCFGGETEPVVTASAAGSLGRGMRRHRNYWNAYLLFYERVTPENMNNIAHKVSNISISNSEPREKSPTPALPPASVSPKLMLAVNEWNAFAGHRRLHFSMPYFTFCKQLLTSCCDFTPSDTLEAKTAAKYGLKLASRHLFELALRVRRSIRGNANDLTECCTKLLQKADANDRRGFILFTGLLNPESIWDYVVDCQSQEVRLAVARMISGLIDITISDPPLFDESHPISPNYRQNLEKLPQLVQDYLQQGQSPGLIIFAVCLGLIRRRDFMDYIRHASPLLIICCDTTTVERRKLAIRLNLPSILLHLLLDDTFTSTARHHQTELNPFCSCLSLLIRSWDFPPPKAEPTDKNQMETNISTPVKANPYAEKELLGSPPQAIFDFISMYFENFELSFSL